ncbi:hypothetical protein [Variovorax sp. GT1P44]|uniref:hypothetical protein n=1 Tax=Variovorax sp. GT1P44 TaxID=3443742 RepID=UPI003F457D81
MDLVDHHGRQGVLGREAEPDAAKLAVHPHHADALGQLPLDVDRPRLGLMQLHHAAHSCHDIAGARGLSDDLV